MTDYDYVWGYLDGGKVEEKNYKVFWDIAIKHTEDGYFYRSVSVVKGFKYTTDKEQAEKILGQINAAIQLLGLVDKAETGIKEE